MEKNKIYLGNNQLDKQGLCQLIIGHLSRNNERVKENMVKYHMEEIKNVSDMLIRVLGGYQVEARAFNSYFYAIIIRLGYSINQLTSPENEQVGKVVSFY